MKARRQRPLFIIDIAVPRDVEGSAGDLEQVFLYNIDDLQAVVQENISRRGTVASEAEKIVAQEVEQFVAWLNSRGAVPTIVALRQRFEIDQTVGAAAPRAEAGVAATRGARARRRNHAAHHGKAADQPDRTAESRFRCRHRRRLQRRAEPALRPAGDEPADDRLADHGAGRLRTAKKRRTVSTLRLGSRGSQLALFQARLVAERIRVGRRARVRDRRHQDVGRSPAGSARSPKSAASGCSSRKSKTRCSAATSISPCTAARTCRQCCPTDSTSAPCSSAKIPEMRSSCVRSDPYRWNAPGNTHGRRSIAVRVSGRIGTGSVRRIAQLRALFPTAVVHERARQSRHTTPQARRRRLRSPRACRGRIAAARIRRAHLGDRIASRSACPPQGRASSPLRFAPTMPRARRAVARVNDADASAALEAERALVVGARRRLPDADWRHRRCL